MGIAKKKSLELKKSWSVRGGYCNPRSERTDGTFDTSVTGNASGCLLRQKQDGIEDILARLIFLVSLILTVAAHCGEVLHNVQLLLSIERERISTAMLVLIVDGL